MTYMITGIRTSFCALAFRSMTAYAAALIVAALMVAVPALAGALDQPKAQGMVGEGLNGYAAVVNPAAPDNVRQLVNDINNQRRAYYQGIATKNGTSLQAVETVFGQRLVNEAAPGTVVQDPSGNWVRK